MEKRIRLISFVCFLLFAGCLMLSWSTQKKSREFYQLTVYHFKTPVQEKTLDTYFENGLLPALHRIGVKNVGVFKSWSNDTIADKMMYVFMPMKSLDELALLPSRLQQDQSYTAAAKDYIEAGAKTPPYSRMERVVLRAFPLAPQMQLPKLSASKKQRVYELRSYESATERLNQNKVQMFNEGGEIEIFKRLNFNPVFYGEVLAGSRMPNLMYMTSFENRADRDSHWKNFNSDPQWKKVSSMPGYQNNVSHADISFLYPTDYSDF